MTGLMAFLTGGAGRWLLGELLAFFKAKQERSDELARMRLQLEQDRERHQWQQQAIAAQAAAGVQVVQAQAAAAEGAAAAQAFAAAVGAAADQADRTDWVGAWNASVRPLLATVAIALLAANAVLPSHVVLGPLLMDLICASLGVFVGERIRVRGA